MMSKKSSAERTKNGPPATTYKPYSSRLYNDNENLVTSDDNDYISSMFSMKIKWVWFASSKIDLKEQLKTQSIKPKKIGSRLVLMVYHDDELFLVKDKCPHQGASLTNATCEDGMIVCPWHRYGFDLKTGRGAGLCLDTYPIEERDDGLYAGFEYFSWFGE